NYHRHVYLHRLGSDPAKDEKVFGAGRAQEDWPNVALSPDGRWLVVTEQQGWAKSEVYFKDCRKEGGTFVPLVEKVPALFSVTVRNARFSAPTNDRAPRSRLFAVDPHKPAQADWVEVIPEGDDVLEGVAAIGDSLIAQYMHKAASRLRWLDRQGKP